MPLYLLQGLAHPHVELLGGRASPALLPTFSEVAEVLLLQLFDRQNETNPELIIRSKAAVGSEVLGKMRIYGVGGFGKILNSTGETF